MRVYGKRINEARLLITRPEIEEIIRGLDTGEGGAVQSAVNVLTAVKDRDIRFLTQREGAHYPIVHTMQPER